MNQENFNCQSNTIAIKAQCDNEWRRFTINVPSVKAVATSVSNLFHLGEKPLVLKYKDEEGDLITFTSDEELAEALRVVRSAPSGPLRVYVSVGNDQAGAAPEAPKKKHPSPCEERRKARRLAQEEKLKNREDKMKIKEDKLKLKQEKIKAKEEKMKLKEERVKAREERDNQRKNWRAQWANLSPEEKEKRKAEKRAEWSNLSPEDREKRRAERGSCWAEKRATWANLSPEEREKLCAEKRGKWASMSPEDREKFRAEKAARWSERRAECPNGVRGRRHRFQELGLDEGSNVERCARGPCKGRGRGRFVKHVTIPDNTELAPGQSFTKTWKFRNDSDSAWPEGCKLLFISHREGDKMNAPESVPVPKAVSPGEEVDISADMRAPQEDGHYCSFWRLADSEGRKFGQRVWVKIDVVGNAAATTPTPVCKEEKCAEEATPQSVDKLEREVEMFFKLGQDDEQRSVTPPPTETASGKPTVASLLRQLKEMGFGEDVGRNIALIKQLDGNLELVIAALMAD